ncbi:MAG: hypothetical protein QXT45_02985 [Candidatus Bilamarchaeaceae archaeon]
MIIRSNGADETLDRNNEKGKGSKIKDGPMEIGKALKKFPLLKETIFVAGVTFASVGLSSCTLSLTGKYNADVAVETDAGDAEIVNEIEDKPRDPDANDNAEPLEEDDRNEADIEEENQNEEQQVEQQESVYDAVDGETEEEVPDAEDELDVIPDEPLLDEAEEEIPLEVEEETPDAIVDPDAEVSDDEGADTFDGSGICSGVTGGSITDYTLYEGRSVTVGGVTVRCADIWYGNVTYEVKCGETVLGTIRLDGRDVTGEVPGDGFTVTIHQIGVNPTSGYVRVDITVTLG